MQLYEYQGQIQYRLHNQIIVNEIANRRENSEVSSKYWQGKRSAQLVK